MKRLDTTKTFDLKEMKRLYFKEHKSIYKIAEIYGSSISTIWRFFKKNGVKMDYRDLMKRHIRTEEHCRNISEANKGRMHSIEEKENIRKGMKRACEKGHSGCFEKGHIHIVSESMKKKISEGHKQLWKDEVFVAMKCKTANIKPNKAENKVFNILESIFPGEWKCTGDFSFTIDGKNPDFVNCNGQKKIIELFGDYWHKGDNPDDRKKTFAPYGYETLVIWENELKDVEKITTKIRAFNEMRASH